jgi:hypothetical protein
MVDRDRRSHGDLPTIGKKSITTKLGTFRDGFANRVMIGILRRSRNTPRERDAERTLYSPIILTG